MRLWARIGMQQERYPGAEVLLRQAVEVAPDFSLAWADLCDAQFKQEKFEETIKSAKKLIKLQPRVPDGHMMLASAAASAGHYQDALEYFDNALEIAPNKVPALCAKGNPPLAIEWRGRRSTSPATTRSRPSCHRPHYSPRPTPNHVRQYDGR